MERASQIAERIDAGTTWVNQHGREMGVGGLEEFCDLQVVSVKRS